MTKKLSVPHKAEVLFDVLYLFVIAVLGLYLLWNSQNTVRVSWGWMALVLLCGDACHLFPRMLAALSGEKERFRIPLGWGKFFASVTMAIFYLILWNTGLRVYSLHLPLMTGVQYILVSARICLCLLPQNGWAKAEPDYKWGVYRNIPFIMQGICVFWIYVRYRAVSPTLQYMWVAIFLSFLFYLPIVFFAGKTPKLGMLMLPKSCAYIWIVAMGLFL